MSAPLNIAMLTYSVKPRGGVVHAVEVSEALERRGHHVELGALARPGETLFRPTPVALKVVRHVPADGVPFDDRIAAMLEAYADGLARLLPGGGHDVVHAQDCLSANAALDLRDRGLVGHVIRTVHHVDDFTSPSLIECQERSIVEPDRVLCVSRPWAARLAEDFDVAAELVRNGVDTARFRPPADAGERTAARRALDLDGHFAVLTVGGIEPRKGSLVLLEAFARLRGAAPGLDPVLLIAGGTTLFDYRDELERFAARARELGMNPHVRVLGPQTPAGIERLYRAADAFAFPSVKEGFGLAALEALAAELPVVASDLDVFREFLCDGDSALLAPTGDSDALADALLRVATEPELVERLREHGRAVAAEWSWDAAALSHERAYAAFLAAGSRAA
jgi:glycosyltransferase-like protein